MATAASAHQALASNNPVTSTLSGASTSGASTIAGAGSLSAGSSVGSAATSSTSSILSTSTSTSTSTVPSGCSSTTTYPADKSTTTGSNVARVPSASDTVLLSTCLRTSTPEDLVLQVTLECSILTQVSTTGTSFAEAQGTITVWVTVDGNKVPVDHTQPATDANSKVTYCHRDAQQTFTDETGGNDMLTEYLDTKDANGFNWANFDTGDGIHLVQVHATLTTSTAGSAIASGYVGNRTLVIDPTKVSPTSN